MGAFLRALTKQETIELQHALGAKDMTSKVMQDAIAEWFAAWYERTPADCADPCQRLPYAIVSKLCKAVFGEYDSSLNAKTMTDGMRFLDGARRALDAHKGELMQWCMVGGAALAKPVLTGGGLDWRCLRRNSYIVLGRGPDGELTDLCSSEKSADGRSWYTLLERRTATAGGVRISNRLYVSENEQLLGRPIPLNTLEKYARLPDECLYAGIGGVGLVQMRMPIVNCVDGSQDGISLLEPVSGLIRAINRNEYQLSREFELGRARVIASEDMLKCYNGRKRLEDDLFVGMAEDPARVGLTIFAPELRNANYEQRRQAYLKAIENLLGIKRGILSDVEAAERTATEVNSSAGDYAISIMELQSLWYDTLREALELAYQTGLQYGLCEEGCWDPGQLAVTWGNGVLYDADKEWAELRQMVADGLLKPEIALARKFDLPCETEADLAEIRKKYMPQARDLEGLGA